jgi:hypothetical protein
MGVLQVTLLACIVLEESSDSYDCYCSVEALEFRK